MKKFLLTVTTALSVLSAVAQSGPKGLEVGDKAPGFAAKNQYGKKVELQSVLKKGPAVLVFYRGQWCPYCNKQLSELEDSLGQITGKGAMVLAVTPEKSESIDMTVSKTKASFSILHDEGLKIMKEYDVAYMVDAMMSDKLMKYGVDLKKNNGSNGNNLPVPAVYIINKNGEIIYKHFDADYTKRASVKEILSYL
ncbi:MAG: hypothetical protein BGO70_11145 [Bacteroidetes bacterium 43-93]|jgi:peroxiredoxin|nr:AhpC/TSA family protein [Bacteroidota bacterium]OJW95665.1 MAG: hypothetical protein BGO70_11145 [Bacteroidetes bacterium 43-93]